MATDSQPDPLVGQTLLDKLKVIGVLGGGGMGSVYEVEHLFTGHRRALKLIKPAYVRRRTFMKRLVREASVAGKLQTPYVVETYDAGVMEDGSAYVLMELLHGKLLIDLLEHEEILEVSRVVGIMAQVCEGVAVAHGAGIIHRDLKPENVFLVEHASGHERVKILDFGISKFKDQGDEATRLTAEGTILGTPFYMSPEQAAAKEVDERTDVYSVGVMLYEALTGRLPFDAKSVGALFIKIAAGEYLPLRHFRPDVDAEFAAVVERAMARDRDRRFQTMEALRTALLPWAPAELRVRTKTISDSPKPGRGTVGYEEHLPPASPAPSKGTLSMGTPPASAPARDEEPAPPAPASTGGTLGRRLPWILGAAALLALGAVLLLAGGQDEPDPSTRAPAEVSDPPAVDPAPEQPSAEAEPEASAEGAAEEPADAADEPEQAQQAQQGADETPAEATPPERHHPIRRPILPRHRDPEPTPAEQAGLEGNPYGMR